jgi:hypothetical protein
MTFKNSMGLYNLFSIEEGFQHVFGEGAGYNL